MSSRSDPTFVDLETSGLADVEQYYDDSEPIEAPSNYVKPEAIENYIARETVRRKQAFIDKAALDPDLCRIVYLGVWWPGQPAPCLMPCEDESAERRALREFWQCYAPGLVFCGFNIRSYDLSVIYRRCLYLGVAAPAIERDRYRSTHVIDLFELLNEGRRHQMHSLDWYHQRFGFQPYLDDITGADVPACVARGEWGKVRDHLMLDLLRTRDVAQRIGVAQREVAA